MNMLKRFIRILCVSSLAIGLWGCSSEENSAEIVDLDDVLSRLDDTISGDINRDMQDMGKSKSALSEPFITPVEQEDDAKTQEFLTQFANKLNEGDLSSKNIGVALNDNGVIVKVSLTRMVINKRHQLNRRSLILRLTPRIIG